MANSKTFKVTTDIKIDRASWRSAGFGDQPSKAEVFEVFADFTSVWFYNSQTVVDYLGAPGYYRVTQTVRATQPWWRRLGFGVSASKREIHDEWAAAFSQYAKDLWVGVEVV